MVATYTITPTTLWSRLDAAATMLLLNDESYFFGKTGIRHIPLIQSIPYIKDWLSNHPTRNNAKAPLFIGLGRNSMGRQLNINGLNQIYIRYKQRFFPKLLEDPTISNEDKEKIKNLLAKPFNPYIRRHSALKEKSIKLKSNTLNQHAGWSMNSHMAQKYIHYFGNESSESLLEAYGIVTKNNTGIDTLNPIIILTAMKVIP
jgi:integrase/recombinase XerD